jgi:hypothetical protein
VPAIGREAAISGTLGPSAEGISADMNASDPSTTALAPLLEAFSPMSLHVRRSSGPIVGRRAEQDAIRQELASAAAGRLSGLTLDRQDAPPARRR